MVIMPIMRTAPDASKKLRFCEGELRIPERVIDFKRMYRWFFYIREVTVFSVKPERHHRPRGMGTCVDDPETEVGEWAHGCAESGPDGRPGLGV